jgi:hypothetical protein
MIKILKIFFSIIFVLVLFGCAKTEEQLSEAKVIARLREGPFPLVKHGEWEYRFEDQGKEDKNTLMSMNSVSEGKYEISFGNLRVMCFIYDPSFDDEWEIRCISSSASLLAGILGPQV